MKTDLMIKYVHQEKRKLSNKQPNFTAQGTSKTKINKAQNWQRK